MKKLLFSSILTVLCTVFAFSQNKTVTFQVSAPDSTPVFVFGSWNWGGWPGTQMTAIGGGFYTASLSLSANTAHQYLFVNGHGTTPAKEALVPTMPCTNGDPQYTNRLLNLGNNDTTVCNQWASCNTCTAPASGTIMVTFQVQNPDMTPAYVFGSWSNWTNWPGDQMTSVGNGLYSVTLPLSASSTFEYLFVNGTTPAKEVLDPTFACTNHDPTYTNRTLTTGTVNETICRLWATCTTCQGVVTTPVSLPVTFDNNLVSYGLTDFGGNGSTIVADPTNASNMVAKSIKSATAELWAGTTVGGSLGFNQNIPFAAGATKMNLRVWSPDANIQVRLKVEDPNDPTKSVETEATTTAAGAWQTLVFNFANQATGTAPINYSYNYRKASVFFNFGVTGVQVGSDKTYYWDDMMFGEVVATENILKDQLRVSTSKDGIRLVSSTLTDVASVQIFDILGRNIYQNTKLTTNTLIPVSLVANSVYFISVKAANTTATFKAVIVE